MNLYLTQRSLRCFDRMSQQCKSTFSSNIVSCLIARTMADPSSFKSSTQMDQADLRFTSIQHFCGGLTRCDLQQASLGISMSAEQLFEMLCLSMGLLSRSKIHSRSLNKMTFLIRRSLSLKIQPCIHQTSLRSLGLCLKLATMNSTISLFTLNPTFDELESHLWMVCCAASAITYQEIAFQTAFVA